MLGKYKKQFMILLGIIIGTAILNMYPIKYIEKVVNLSMTMENDKVNEIIMFGVIYIILHFIRGFFVSYLFFFTKRLQITVSTELRNTVFKSLLDSKLEQFTNIDLQEVNNRIIEDSEFVSNNMVEPYTNILFSILTFVFGFYYMAKINLYLTLIIIPLGIISSFITKYIHRESSENISIERRLSSKLWKVFQEGILGLIPIKVHNYEETYNKMVKHSGKNLEEVNIKQIRLESISNYITTFIFMTTIGIIMIVSSLFVVKGHMSIGGLTAIMMYNHMLTDPLINIVNESPKLSKLNVSFARIKEITDYEKENSLKKTNIDRVNLENVRYSYFDMKDSLFNIDFSINKGEKIAIMGESGSGKSTLVNIILGIYEPTGGTVKYYNNNKIVNGDLKYSYMVQDEYIFDDSIVNNIKIGKYNANKEEVKHILKICRLDELIKSKEDQNVGMYGNKLSGGERKRVLLGRCLIDDSADLFILDELSSSLDKDNFAFIMNNILKDRRFENKMFIFIDHNKDIKKYVDKVYNLD